MHVVHPVTSFHSFRQILLNNNVHLASILCMGHKQSSAYARMHVSQVEIGSFQTITSTRLPSWYMSLVLAEDILTLFFTDYEDEWCNHHLDSREFWVYGTRTNKHRAFLVSPLACDVVREWRNRKLEWITPGLKFRRKNDEMDEGRSMENNEMKRCFSSFPLLCSLSILSGTSYCSARSAF